MPVDPSVITQGQLPQFQNPIDNYGKILTLQNLGMKNQADQMANVQQKQAFSDDQAQRSAYNNNVTVDQNGNASVDNQGLLKDLAKSAPSLVPKAAAQLATQQQTLREQKFKSVKDQLDLSAQLAGSVTDQDSLDKNRQIAQASGLDVSQIPTEYNPATAQVLKAMQARALSAKDQMDQGIKQKDLDIKQQDLDVKRQQFAEGKTTEAFKDLMSHAESSRQLPDVKQAYLDRYNSQKVIDLISSKKDPNKIDYNMVPIISGEIGKIATGGVPTHEELKMITPQDANMIMARTKQYLSSHPEASQQGAFLNVFKDYAGTIQSGANKVIGANIGQLYDSYKDHLKPSDATTFENTFIKGNPYSLKQTKDAIGETNEGTASNKKDTKQDYSVSAVKSLPIGSVLNGQTKTKNGWVTLDASK